MNVFICDNCLEYALLCEDKILHLAEKYGIRLNTKIFQDGDSLLFETESFLMNMDLLYLDVQIPGEDGLRIARKLRDMGYKGDIVFYAVSPKYAIEGYDVSALHYIVKDVTSDKKFEEIFDRALKRKQRREQELLVLTCAGESRCIPIQDIHYFEVNSRIVTVYYEGGQFQFYSTIARLEEQLFGKGFVRIQKSFLVNIRNIRLINSKYVILDTGERLPVGKKYYGANLKNLKSALCAGSEVNA